MKEPPRVIQNRYQIIDPHRNRESWSERVEVLNCCFPVNWQLENAQQVATPSCLYYESPSTWLWIDRAAALDNGIYPSRQVMGSRAWLRSQPSLCRQGPERRRLEKHGSGCNWWWWWWGGVVPARTCTAVSQGEIYGAANRCLGGIFN